MQVRRPCGGEEEKVGEGRCVLAYAKVEAIKRAEDKGDEDGYKDKSKAVQIGN